MKKIIRLVRRARKKNKPKRFLSIYDICVVNTSAKGKRVFEKLGTYNASGYTKLNVFRLLYWIARGVRLSGNTMEKLEFMNIIKFN